MTRSTQVFGPGVTVAEVQHAIATGRLHIATAMLEARGENAKPEWLMLHAAVAARSGDQTKAENILRRVLSVSPDNARCTSALIFVLRQQFRYADSLAVADEWLKKHPEDVQLALQRAAILGQCGKYNEALTATGALIRQLPTDARIWVYHGHWLKVTGQAQAAWEALQQASSLAPSWAEPWWHMANLKRRSNELEIGRMQRLLHSNAETVDGQVYLHFALAAALEATRDFSAAFRHFEQGNKLRRKIHVPDMDALDRWAKKTADFCTDSSFVSAAADAGGPSPIFIIGMPRSATTLIEQMLDAHTAIEGLGELPYIEGIANQIGTRDNLHERMTTLSSEELSALGRRYKELAAVHRKTDKPFFVDKMPSNWQYLPLIQAIIPDSRIIDARRNPLDCCWSNYRQHYPHGHDFAYSFDDLAKYYRLYRSVIRASVVSGRGSVHAFVYERLLTSASDEVTSLLEHLGLPLQAACLQPHKNVRSIETPSAEQVRQPISASFSGQWRHYEQWLEPLRLALDSAIDEYAAPDCEE